jgi:hypothetical protein
MQLLLKHLQTASNKQPSGAAGMVGKYEQEKVKGGAKYFLFWVIADPFNPPRLFPLLGKINSYF